MSQRSRKKNLFSGGSRIPDSIVSSRVLTVQLFFDQRKIFKPSYGGLHSFSTLSAPPRAYFRLWVFALMSLFLLPIPGRAKFTTKFGSGHLVIL